MYVCSIWYRSTRKNLLPYNCFSSTQIHSKSKTSTKDVAGQNAPWYKIWIEAKMLQTYVRIWILNSWQRKQAIYLFHRASNDNFDKIVYSFPHVSFESSFYFVRIEFWNSTLFTFSIFDTFWDSIDFDKIQSTNLVFVFSFFYCSTVYKTEIEPKSKHRIISKVL